MGGDQHIDWTQGARSVLDWWREAGVDVLVDDTPRDWLVRTPKPTEAVVADAPAEARLPDTLDAFAAWRVGPEAPEGAGGVFAEGDRAADLMVVTDFPDGESLMEGAAGRLFERMLAAIGMTRATIYLAPLSTLRPLGGRIAPESMAELADLLRHHVALAGAKRLLVLGQAPSRALLGSVDGANARSLHAINLQGGTVTAVSSLHPRFLVEKPAMKAEAWKDLLLLMGGRR